MPEILLIMKKIPVFNLQEMLIVLAIIGLLLLIALPSLMPLIAKANSVQVNIVESKFSKMSKIYWEAFKNLVSSQR